MTRPTSIRIVVAALLTLMACLLYLDRYAVGIASESMRVDLNMTQTQMSWFLSAFFWSYALCQVPAGWLSDRFGPRIMLTVYILGWSLFTGLLGVTTQVSMVLLFRFLCGATQAGAYPVCSGMIRNWFPTASRGTASSVVAMGGRSGAVLAPILTAALMTAFAGLAVTYSASVTGDAWKTSLLEGIAGGWRPVLVSYGLVGILVAFAFAAVSRDVPSDHPWCNDAERDLINDKPSHTHSSDVTTTSAVINATAADEPTKTIEVTQESQRFPLVPLLTSVSLWGNSLSQFFTNIGWLFVVTWLPRYLEKVHAVPLKEQALMTAIPTLAGIVGMLSGGWWTDVSARRLGLKWGRRLPIAATRFTAAMGYGVCLALATTYLPDPNSRWLPWMIVAGLSVATFSCDFGVPAVWAYSQDVGGKFTASVMGWSNMHGNFGAAVAPLMYNAILGETPTLSQWNSLFAFCMTVFVLSGICGMLVDATKPIAHKN
jgi:ACS family glucarate transporter-like MFS transporter